MLARRFVIVCLLFFIFGSGLSILVAETARPTRSRTTADFALSPLHMSGGGLYIRPWKTEHIPVR